MNLGYGFLAMTISIFLHGIDRSVLSCLDSLGLLAFCISNSITMLFHLTNLDSLYGLCFIVIIGLC